MLSDQYQIIIVVGIVIAIFVLHEFGIKTPIPKLLVRLYRKIKWPDEIVYTDSNTSTHKIFFIQLVPIIFLISFPLFFRLINKISYESLEPLRHFLAVMYLFTFLWFLTKAMELYSQLSKISNSLSQAKNTALYIPFFIFIIVLLISILSILPEAKHFMPLSITNYFNAS